MTVDWTQPNKPYAIAHRGASAYAQESSFRAFEVAAELGADFWELDIRLTSDHQLVVFHDPALPNGKMFEFLPWAEVEKIARDHKISAPLLDDVLRLAAKFGTGIYADIKDNRATLPTLEALQSHGIERAILGAFDPNAAEILRQANCPYPRSALVPIGADPFEHSKGADVIHLCWEHMDRPQDLLDEEFLERARQSNQLVALWHEEDPVRMDALRPLPVLGICSDRPELVRPFEPSKDWPVDIVCHRGAETVAPENTLEAARCAFGAGFSYVELDVRQTKDGVLVVIHDDTLDRTTDGHGPVTHMTWDDVQNLDAGGWFSEHFSGEKVPKLEDMLALAREYGRQLYIEIKQADPAHILKAVEDHNMLDHCFFWSFNFAYLRTIHDLNENAQIMLRRQDFDRFDDMFDEFNPAIIEFAGGDDFADLKRCEERGCRSMIAYMGHNKEHFQTIIDLQPDLVNLSQVFLFRQYLEQNAASLGGDILA